MEKRGDNFCGIGGDRLPLEFIGITPNQSELIEINLNQSGLIGANRINPDKFR